MVCPFPIVGGVCHFRSTSANQAERLVGAGRVSVVGSQHGSGRISGAWGTGLLA